VIRLFRAIFNPVGRQPIGAQQHPPDWHKPNVIKKGGT
jgi:hypothetical protein